jgi:hypothetical protein
VQSFCPLRENRQAAPHEIRSFHYSGKQRWRAESTTDEALGGVDQRHWRTFGRQTAYNGVAAAGEGVSAGTGTARLSAGAASFFFTADSQQRRRNHEEFVHFTILGDIFKKTMSGNKSQTQTIIRGIMS